MIFLLDDLFIVESQVLKCPTIIALLSIPTFRYLNNCLIDVGAPVLGTCIFIWLLGSLVAEATRVLLFFFF